MTNKLSIANSFSILAALFLLLPNLSFAQTADELRQKIADREASIRTLETEIAATQMVIDKSRTDQKTLANAIKLYDAERKKLLAQINVTTEKISAKELEISSIGLSIDDKNKTISSDMDGLAHLLRYRDSLDGENTLVAFLNNADLTGYWDSLHQNEILSESIGQRVSELKTTKSELESDKLSAEQNRNDMKNLSRQLSAQKQAAEANLTDKQSLLKLTKNTESEYQKILNQKVATKNSFEKEMLDFESQLNFAIDPNSVPSASSGILHWPLDVIKITQYFGNTAFAMANAAVYNGAGHNGVDFAASVGTPIKAALNGTVKGTGNTDLACPNASYGKWILLEHPNGLSTLYAHLSAFSVKAGDSVATGDTIGLSGNTGYTTGPHLHFTVYATEGVRIMNRQSKVCSGVYIMPVADLKAYLNPMSYL